MKPVPTAALTRRAWLAGRGAQAAALSMPWLATSAAANASDTPPWPSRPLRILVVYPPGGVSDAMARALAQQLQAALGVPVVIDNRPGAGGSVGMEALARAAPDGHTLAFSAISPVTLATHALAVTPVAPVMRTPVLIVGTPAFTGTAFEDVIAQARQRPGALRWATSGRATIGHLVLAQVRRIGGIDIVHVPYQGGGPQLNDALGGQFELLSTNVAALQLRYVAEGRFKALAVGAPARLAALPGVPTLAELGFAEANLESLFGVFAPAQTPPERVEWLNRAIGQVMASAPMRERLRTAYNLPAVGSEVAFAREIAADRMRLRALMREAPRLLD